MAVSRKDVAALAGTPPEPAAEITPEAPAAPRPFMSEGTRHDLEFFGQATDPASGAVFVRDADTGEVIVVERVPAGE